MFSKVQLAIRGSGRLQLTFPPIPKWVRARGRALAQALPHVAPADAAVSRSVTIPMPARSPETLPRPVTTHSQPAPSQPQKPGARRLVLTVLAAVVGLFAALTTLGLAFESSTDLGAWIVAGVLWCATVAAAVPVRRARRDAARSRRR